MVPPHDLWHALSIQIKQDVAKFNENVLALIENLIKDQSFLVDLNDKSSIE
jgi:hypothetical protein